MTRRWARFWTLPAGQRKVLVQALAWLPATAVMLRVFGLRRCQAWAVRGQSESVASEVEAMRTAREVAGLVGAAAGALRVNCLCRSMVLWRLLRRAGICADLRIGARRLSPDRPPDFHAWVELRGEVLNEGRDVIRTFAAFPLPIGPQLPRP